MEGPIAIKKQSATIIGRYLKRVSECNKAHDYIQQLLRQKLPTNDSSIIGVPIMDLSEMYHYRMTFGGICYAYDIRELFQILKSSYQTAKCPYTNRRFTRYQKYRIIRYFYKKNQLPGFEDLIMNQISYRDYNACSAKVNALIDEYSRFDIETINDVHLFNLLTELMKFDTKDCVRSVSYVSQAHHHYINGNMRNYRACVYMFLIHMIEGADDRSLAILRIQVRIEYCQEFPVTDPIEVRQLRMSDLLTMLSEPESESRPLSLSHSPPQEMITMMVNHPCAAAEQTQVLTSIYLDPIKAFLHNTICNGITLL